MKNPFYEPKSMGRLDTTSEESKQTEDGLPPLDMINPFYVPKTYSTGRLDTSSQAAADSGEDSGKPSMTKLDNSAQVNKKRGDGKCCGTKDDDCDDCNKINAIENYRDLTARPSMKNPFYANQEEYLRRKAWHEKIKAQKENLAADTAAAAQTSALYNCRACKD